MDSQMSQRFGLSQGTDSSQVCPLGTTGSAGDFFRVSQQQQQQQQQQSSQYCFAGALSQPQPQRFPSSSQFSSQPPPRLSLLSEPPMSTNATVGGRPLVHSFADDYDGDVASGYHLVKAATAAFDEDAVVVTASGKKTLVGMADRGWVAPPPCIFDDCVTTATPRDRGLSPSPFLKRPVSVSRAREDDDEEETSQHHQDVSINLNDASVCSFQLATNMNFPTATSTASVGRERSGSQSRQCHRFEEKRAAARGFDDEDEDAPARGATPQLTPLQRAANQAFFPPGVPCSAASPWCQVDLAPTTTGVLASVGNLPYTCATPPQLPASPVFYPRDSQPVLSQSQLTAAGSSGRMTLMGATRACRATRAHPVAPSPMPPRSHRRTRSGGDDGNTEQSSSSHHRGAPPPQFSGAFVGTGLVSHYGGPLSHPASQQQPSHHSSFATCSQQQLRSPVPVRYDYGHCQSALCTPRPSNESISLRAALDAELDPVNSIGRGIAPKSYVRVTPSILLGKYPSEAMLRELSDREGVTHVITCCGNDRLLPKDAMRRIADFRSAPHMASCSQGGASSAPALSQAASEIGRLGGGDALQHTVLDSQDHVDYLILLNGDYEHFRDAMDAALRTNVVVPLTTNAATTVPVSPLLGHHADCCLSTPPQTPPPKVVTTPPVQSRSQMMMQVLGSQQQLCSQPQLHGTAPKAVCAAPAVAAANTPSVYVHCVSGVNRSVTLLIAYMMQRQYYTLLDAVRALRAAGRLVILNNHGFRQQLVDFALALQCAKGTA